MTYKECNNAYNKWERLQSGQIFINHVWETIIDIEEDAHRGWICKTSKETIELSDIERYLISFPMLY